MAPRKSSRSVSQKLAAKRKAQEKRLQARGNGGKHLVDTKRAKLAVEAKQLKQIFRILRGAALAPKERAALVASIEKNLIDATKTDRLPPKFFLAKSWGELADLIVRRFEGMETASTTFRAFSAAKRGGGFQSGLRGWLFHRFVRGLEPLQKDLFSMALGHVEALNSLARAPTKKLYLINALGQKVKDPVRFRRPVKTKRVDIVKEDGTPVESVDDVYLSRSGGKKIENSDALWSFSVEVESKTLGAAGGFGEQIGFAQPRFHGAEKGGSINVVRKVRIRITLDDGSLPFEIAPKQLVSHPSLANRVAITNTSSKDWDKIVDVLEAEKTDIDSHLRDPKGRYALSGFQFSSTEKGYRETYLRVKLAIRTLDINKLVQASLPLLSKAARR